MTAARPDIVMSTDMVSSLRLFQLISPSLPTGAFTYSQGLEYAVECGWVKDELSLNHWLSSLLFSSHQELEIPLLKRFYDACIDGDLERFSYWIDFLVSCRETNELRLEEKNRGRAMARLLSDLDIETPPDWLETTKRCQAAGFGLAAARWQIDLRSAALGYTWSWLDNMVMAAVKIVPLGQTSGQRVLADLGNLCSEVVEKGLAVEDKDIGGSCPAFVIGSCLHETQYTRLFRS